MGIVFLDIASAVRKRKVDDVCKASIVHKDSLGIKSFYREYYD